jgi:hypothetical protein
MSVNSANITPAALHRQRRFEADDQMNLLKSAEKAGIRIVVIEKTGQHIAVDPVAPWAYLVDRAGCDCPHFAVCGKCRHHALLMAELGELVDPKKIGWPDDPPAATMVAD